MMPKTLLPPLRPVMEGAVTRREIIRQKAVEGLQTAFPMKAGKHTLELSNISVEPREYSSAEQKRALLEGKTLSERVRGDVTVKNAANETTDHVKNFTLLQLPYFTQRHTFILDGTEYSVANQLRTKPGVYMRRKGNDELESTFNLSKGANFRILMEPDKGLLYMQPTFSTSNIPLHPILKALGVPHQDIANAWGAAVANMNRDAFKSPDKHVDKLYQTLIHPSKQVAITPEDKAKGLRDYFEATAMDPEVTQQTLGHGFDKASPMAILAASKKLLDVHKAADDVDDRDALSFKTFHSVDDFIKERLGLDAKAMRTKIGWKLDSSHGSLKKAVPSGVFTRSLQNLLTGSSLSAVPMQINPVELISDAARVTMLGEGAISSDRAIPMETRDLHSSHFGILDPARSPESMKVGVDLRAAIGTRRDAKGNLYAPVLDIKTGKSTFLSSHDMAKSVIAFPGEEVKAGKLVDAMVKGVVSRISADKVTHQIEHVADQFSASTNLLPLVFGMQGNRTLMASKHQGQALPLVYREAPLVQAESWKPGISMEKEIMRLIVPTAPSAGVISKIDGDYIHFTPSEHKTSAEAMKLHYDTNFPLAAKTMLNNTLRVKVGDHVKAGELLADSNFSKDGTLALGTNLNVAYMAYRGLNSNDGMVVSQGAADKLVSEHVYQHMLDKTGENQLGREKHRAYFGGKYTKAQYDKLDAEGVVRPGTILHYGDPIAVGVRENKPTGDALLLGKLSKSLIKPYEEVAEIWRHERPGEVLDVAKTHDRVAASVKTQETLQVGDKITNRFGGKGVIAAIISDHQMVKDAKGRPIDLLVTSAGVVSRINPNQIVETALGKVAEHLGHPIVVPQYTPGRDNVQYAKDLLKQHGLSDKETVYDPVSGKLIPNIMVGKSYILKLWKTTDSNFSAHDAGRYDHNQQPARGGEDGSKGIGIMEFQGLVGHNARNILRESASIKSQKNDEFWRAVQLGLPTPAPVTSFAYNKLLTMLNGAGVKVDKSASKLALGPLTDADILKMSSGVLTEPNKLIRAKDLRPETGGLFDPARTGGMSGTLWSHVTLHEPIVNPVFEEPVRRLLGFTQKQFTDNVGKGGSFFRDALNNIDVNKKIEELHDKSKTARGTDLDGVVKQIKYLGALKERGLKPGDAYVLNHIPVTPPIIRPILPLPNGKLQVGDANLLYKDAFLANDQLKGAVGVLPIDELGAPRRHLYDAVSAVFGVGDPVSPGNEKRGTKGFIATITGTRPGNGFFQSKILKRMQAPSARATIAPDPTLSMDEVGVPTDMLRTMYTKFVMGRLVKRGYSALDAQKMIEEKHPIAHEELLNEAKERPVLINRAPSLSRFNIIAAFPKLVDGKTLKLNPFSEVGMSADYDGDAVQIHVPVTQGGIEDARKMTLSHLIFEDSRPGALNVRPEHEAVFGLARAAQAATDKKVRFFDTLKDAKMEHAAGKLSLHDPIEIKKS